MDMRDLYSFFRRFDGLPGICTNMDGCCEPGERCNCHDLKEESEIDELNVMLEHLAKVLEDNTTMKNDKSYTILALELLIAYELKLKEMGHEKR